MPSEMLGMLRRSKFMILSAVLENKVECQPLRAFEMKMIQEEIGEGRRPRTMLPTIGWEGPLRSVALSDRQGDG